METTRTNARTPAIQEPLHVARTEVTGGRGALREVGHVDGGRADAGRVLTTAKR
jgi:hypothetical protein